MGAGKGSVWIAHFFRSRKDVNLATRTALVLCPGSGREPDSFGAQRLSEEALRDRRPGRVF